MGCVASRIPCPLLGAQHVNGSTVSLVLLDALDRSTNELRRRSCSARWSRRRVQPCEAWARRYTAREAGPSIDCSTVYKAAAAEEFKRSAELLMQSMEEKVAMVEVDKAALSEQLREAEQKLPSLQF